jgi:preprotein translocase subunit SecB
MGGIESAFQFLSYKIDSFHLDVTKDVRSLAFSGVIGPNQIQLSLGLRNPLHISTDNSYVGGLDVRFSLFFSNEFSDSNRLATGKAGVSGLFKVAAEKLAEEAEKNLVRLQIPALLFPFLRSAVSALLINAGFPGVVIPLINVHELASQAGDKIQIQEAALPPAIGAVPAK